jgi:hypothetical protein
MAYFASVSADAVELLLEIPKSLEIFRSRRQVVTQMRAVINLFEKERVQSSAQARASKSKQLSKDAFAQICLTIPGRYCKG